MPAKGVLVIALALMHFIPFAVSLELLPSDPWPNLAPLKAAALALPGLGRRSLLQTVQPVDVKASNPAKLGSADAEKFQAYCFHCTKDCQYCGYCTSAVQTCRANRASAACVSCTNSNCNSCPGAGSPSAAYAPCGECTPCADCCPQWFQLCKECTYCQYCKYCKD